MDQSESLELLTFNWVCRRVSSIQDLSNALDLLFGRALILWKLLILSAAMQMMKLIQVEQILTVWGLSRACQQGKLTELFSVCAKPVLYFYIYIYFLCFYFSKCREVPYKQTCGLQKPHLMCLNTYISENRPIFT